jgi:glutathione S-transferase
MHSLEVASSSLVSTLAAWRGTSVVQAAVPPSKLLKLYDIEGSPRCRAVREALTALGLDAEIYPCPVGGTRYRGDAQVAGGKQQFPLLVDPNSGVTLYESATIIEYLFRTYGGGSTPWAYRPSKLTPLLGRLTSVVRGLRGTHSRHSRKPKKLLELWCFESSPYSRLVRERLTELELAYVVHNIGKERFTDMGPAAMRIRPGPYKPMPGGRREKVLAQLGRVQAPYLEDPNTGVKMFESKDIIAYLEARYAA